MPPSTPLEVVGLLAHVALVDGCHFRLGPDLGILPALLGRLPL